MIWVTWKSQLWKVTQYMFRNQRKGWAQRTLAAREALLTWGYGEQLKYETEKVTISLGALKRACTKSKYGRRKYSKKIHYPHTCEDGACCCLEGNERREAAILCNRRSGLAPLGGEMVSSVFEWMMQPHTMLAAWWEEQQLGLIPTPPFCRDPCTAHTYSTLHVLQEAT